MAETWRRVWGDGTNFRGPRFLNDGFSEKISVFTAKISDDLFLVIDQDFRIFPFFSQIFRIFTMLNIVYDPYMTLSSQEKPLFHKRISLRHFFLLCSYFRAHPTTLYTSQNIGGRMYGPSPTSNLWAGVAPSPTRSPPLVVIDVTNVLQLLELTFAGVYIGLLLLQKPITNAI